MMNRMMSLLEEAKKSLSDDLSESQRFSNSISSVTQSCAHLTDKCLSSQQRYDI